jgi:hypothetical protein
MPWLNFNQVTVDVMIPLWTRKLAHTYPQRYPQWVGKRVWHAVDNERWTRKSPVSRSCHSRHLKLPSTCTCAPFERMHASFLARNPQRLTSSQVVLQQKKSSHAKTLRGRKSRQILQHESSKVQQPAAPKSIISLGIDSTMNWFKPP